MLVKFVCFEFTNVCYYWLLVSLSYFVGTASQTRDQGTIVFTMWISFKSFTLVLVGCVWYNNNSICFVFFFWIRKSLLKDLRESNVWICILQNHGIFQAFDCALLHLILFSFLPLGILDFCGELHHFRCFYRGFFTFVSWMEPDTTLSCRILASLYSGTLCIWNYQTQVG